MNAATLAMHPRAMSEPSLRAPTQPLTGTACMLLASIAAYVLLSAPTLAALGIPYDVQAGSFPAKIHPGTYLLLLTCLMAWAESRSPWQGLQQSLRTQPMLAAYLGCMLACFVWAVGRHGPAGLAFFIDTLISPGLAGLLLMRMDTRTHGLMLQMVLAILALNAALAIGEYLFKGHLVPGVMGAAPEDSDGYFRSAALLGHPLTNAKVTVAALPFVTRLPWPTRWKLLTGLLLAQALLAFGGRTSLAVGGLVYGATGLACLGLRLAQGRYSYLQITGSGLGVMLLGTTLATAVVSTGLGDRVFQNFTWDNSADVRFAVWRALDHFKGQDVWLGLPIPEIDHVAERIGIDRRFEAIENFWLYQLLLLGVVGFVPFVLGLILLATHLVRSAGPWLWVSVPVYFVVASGTNSLASKTISLMVLTVLTLASQRQQRAPRLVQRDAPLARNSVG